MDGWDMSENGRIFLKNGFDKPLKSLFLPPIWVNSSLAQLVIPQMRDAHAGLIRGSLVRFDGRKYLTKNIPP